MGMIARTARIMRTTVTINFVLLMASLRVSKRELILLLSEQKVSFSFGGTGKIVRSK